MTSSGELSGGVRCKHKLVRLHQIDPDRLVPSVKKITRLEKCNPKPSRSLQTAAKGGGLEGTGSLEA